jgi:4-carboxymuconolactone decarboxylase
MVTSDWLTYRTIGPLISDGEPLNWKEMRMRKILVVMMAVTLLPCAALAQRRMAPIPADKMTPEQQAAAETFKASRGYELKDHLFMDLLRIPDAMLGAFRMREHIRKNSIFGAPLTEFALLLTLRDWSQPQEWSGHVSQAVTAGIRGEVIAAVAEGRYPDGMSGDESIIYNFTTELLRNRSVSDISYDRMVKRWGEAGVIEAINIAALYTIVGMVLNTTREPIPERYNELPTFPQLRSVPLSTYTNPVSSSAGPPVAPAPAALPATTSPAK